MDSQPCNTPSRKITEPLAELGEELEGMPDVGSEAQKAMIGFLTDLTLSGADPENELTSGTRATHAE